MRKLTAIIIALSMILTFNMSFAFAATAPASAKNAASVAYTDVPTWHWANNVIAALSDRGVLGGYPDGSFRPDNMVTRAEFSKMIAIFMELEITTTTVSSFPDVSSNHWALKYIETDKENDLIDGYPDGTFKPNDNIKRSEVSRIIVAANNTLNEKEKSTSSMSTAATQYVPFSDVKGHWAESDILWLKDVGVADAYPDGLFRPERLCSRAEAAKLLYLFLQTFLGEQVTPPASGGSSGGSSGGGDEPDTQTPCPSCPGDLDPDAVDTWTVGPHTEFIEGYASLYVDTGTAEANNIPGAYIVIPEGALDAFDDTITIGLSVDLETLPDGGAILGGTSDGDPVKKDSPVIKITKNNCCNFRLPIEVTIPYGIQMALRKATIESAYAMQDIPSVFYWQNDSVNGNSRYVAVGVEEPWSYLYYNYITFKTVHSGEFVALTIPGLADRIYGSSSESTPTADTGFQHNPNGFNTDTSEFATITNGLPTIGMANYAAWNYGFKSVNLYDRYGGSTRHELISRAFLASSNYWNEYPFNSQDEFFVGYQLIQTMKITDMPQSLIWYNNSLNRGTYLVYSCSIEDIDNDRVITFNCYDPENNTTRPLELIRTEGWYFNADADIGQFKFDGISSSVEPKNYETLFYGAENAWPSTATSDFSKIEITSHSADVIGFDGESEIHITGKVTGGENKPEWITCNVNGEDWFGPNVIDLEDDGSFEIIFHAYGMNALPKYENSIMFYSSCSKCATINRCAVPYSGFKEITIINEYYTVTE